MQYYMTKQIPLGPIAGYSVSDYITVQALGICILMQVSGMAAVTIVTAISLVCFFFISLFV